MGRSRGGLTTKVHAVVDAQGLPLELLLTPGQAADCPAAAQLLGRLRPGAILLADRAYDGDIQMIDTTTVRVHQHAANLKKNHPDRCMGRSRGGLTTKVHALAEWRQLAA